MSEEEFNRIFARNLKKYLIKNDMTQLELSKRLGVGTTSVYNWCNAIKTPRIDKVDAMCVLFGCKRSDLMENKTDTEDYLNKFDLNTFKQLNDTNVTKVNTYAQNLLSIQAMEDEPVLLAAHNDNPTPEQLEKIRRDAKTLRRPDKN